MGMVERESRQEGESCQTGNENEDILQTGRNAPGMHSIALADSLGGSVGLARLETGLRRFKASLV